MPWQQTTSSACPLEKEKQIKWCQMLVLCVCMFLHNCIIPLCILDVYMQHLCAYMCMHPPPFLHANSMWRYHRRTAYIYKPIACGRTIQTNSNIPTTPPQISTAFYANTPNPTMNWKRLSYTRSTNFSFKPTFWHVWSSSGHGESIMPWWRL